MSDLPTPLPTSLPTSFAAAVRHAVARSGLSLREIARHLTRYGPLSSSIATISDWQNGVGTPPRDDRGLGRVLAFERCLGVPAGDLALTLPGLSRATTARPGAGDPLTLRRAVLEREVARRVGPQRVIPVWITKEYQLGWAYVPVMTVVTMEVRALHDGVDRYLFLHAPGARTHPAVVGVDGCTQVGVHRERPPAGPAPRPRPDDAVVEAVELLFGHPLRKGERYRFTFSVGYVDEQPRLLDAEFRHVQQLPCQQLHLVLTFDRAWRPATVCECRWGTDLHLRHRRVWNVRDCVAYESVLTDPVPGGYGWRWSGAVAPPGGPGPGRRAA
ncbi:MAG TPA: hypothetical protein VE547_09365 [Mycobacteriales bacterium]|nr:hypothetical protein [Mycobacteriales bacterium]